MILNRLFSIFKLTLFKGILSLSGFAFSILLSKIFGVSFYGTYFKIIKYVQLSTLVSLIGYPNLLARSFLKKDRYQSISDSILISIPISSIIFTITIYFEFSYLSSFIIFVCYVLLFFNIFSKQYESLELSKINPWKGSLINLSLIHGLIFIIIYIINLLKFNISKDLIFSFILLISICSLVYMVSQLRPYIKYNFNNYNIKLLKSSLYLFSGKLNTIIITKFDIILLSIFFTVEEIGIYAVASRIPSIAEVASNAIRANTIGEFSRNFEQKKYKEFLKTFIHSVLFSLLIILFLNLFFTQTFNYLMNIFELKIQLSVLLLFLFVLPNSLNILFSQLGTVINVTKNEKYLFKASISSIPFVITAMTLGAYFRTLESFLIGLSSAILITNLFKIYYAKKIYDTDFKV